MKRRKHYVGAHGTWLALTFIGMAIAAVGAGLLSLACWYAQCP